VEGRGRWEGRGRGEGKGYVPVPVAVVRRAERVLDAREGGVGGRVGEEPHLGDEVRRVPAREKRERNERVEEEL
jgi:hypothetical protein